MKKKLKIFKMIFNMIYMQWNYNGEKKKNIFVLPYKLKLPNFSSQMYISEMMSPTTRV